MADRLTHIDPKVNVVITRVNGKLSLIEVITTVGRARIKHFSSNPNHPPEVQLNISDKVLGAFQLGAVRTFLDAVAENYDKHSSEDWVEEL